MIKQQTTTRTSFKVISIFNNEHIMLMWFFLRLSIEVLIVSHDLQNYAYLVEMLSFKPHMCVMTPAYCKQNGFLYIYIYIYIYICIYIYIIHWHACDINIHSTLP